MEEVPRYAAMLVVYFCPFDAVSKLGLYGLKALCFLHRQQRRKISTRISKHPETPDVTQICSKRSFDGQAKKWRRELHLWDPEEEEDLIEPVLVRSWLEPYIEEPYYAVLAEQTCVAATMLCLKSDSYL